MKLGDIVFFKRARDTTKKIGHREAVFPGMGFGVLLGHVPPETADPPAIAVMQAMGAIGFTRFDDIAEFLGQEAAIECVKKHNEKYLGQRSLPIPIDVEIRYCCKACKAGGVFVFTKADYEAGGKKFNCEKCGAENECTVDAPVEPSTIEVPQKPRLLGLNGQPVN